MPGIDELISNSLSEKIKVNLDPRIEKTLKMELFKKYGLSIKQGIKDFSKIDNILKELLKSDASIFKQSCLNEIISLKMKESSILVTIKDKKLINFIIEILGDEEYRRVIENTLEKSRLISEIIKNCDLSKTSAYRKINYLIRNGILYPVETEFTMKRRGIERYSPIFKKIYIEINQKQSYVRLEIPVQIFNQSSSIQKMPK